MSHYKNKDHRGQEHDKSGKGYSANTSTRGNKKSNKDYGHNYDDPYKGGKSKSNKDYHYESKSSRKSHYDDDRYYGSSSKGKKYDDYDRDDYYDRQRKDYDRRSYSSSSGSESLSASSSADSFMTEDEEDWEDYVQGGYHPVYIGDQFSDGRYVIVRKLGWGHFSTVWLARDTKYDRHVALKVVKSAARYTETALDEIKLLQRLITSSTPDSPVTHPGRGHVISFLDHFKHKGPNGTHVCMVFEVLGENLLGLVRRFQTRGVPMPLVRQIAKQVLMGLDYMHRYCGVIHTDLKPENVLIAIDNVEEVIRAELEANPPGPAITPKQHPTVPANSKLTGVPPSKGRGKNQSMSQPRITGSQPLSSPSSSFGSLRNLAMSASPSARASGSPAAVDKFNFGMTPMSVEGVTEAVQGVSIRDEEGEGIMFGKRDVSPPTGSSTLLSQQAPEAGSSSAEKLDEREAGAGVELWERITVKIADLGNATWTEHHFTDDIQTRQYRCPEVILGSKWGPSADVWSVACVLFELITGGDYLFDPAAGSRYSKDDDHLAQIIELIGPIPPSISLMGKYSTEFFNRKGELRHIQKLRYWPLEAVLKDKYLFSKEDADGVAGFLGPMLRVDSEKRASAGEMVGHPWLEAEMDRLELPAEPEMDTPREVVEDVPSVEEEQAEEITRSERSPRPPETHLAERGEASSLSESGMPGGFGEGESAVSAVEVEEVKVPTTAREDSPDTNANTPPADTPPPVETGRGRGSRARGGRARGGGRGKK